VLVCCRGGNPPHRSQCRQAAGAFGTEPLTEPGWRAGSAAPELAMKRARPPMLRVNVLDGRLLAA
jgi:hypothetical protein